MTNALSGEAAEILSRVEALVPSLAAEAREAERLRRPTDAQIRSLEEAGVFRMMVPRSFGGLELDLDAFLEVGLALARSDISIAWVTTFCIEHNWMLCQFPERFQKELYAGPDWILAPGVIAPNGKAQKVDGGYRLSGQWQWGTGVMHSSWVLVGAVSDGDEGAAAMRFLALPIEHVEIVDTWYVDGMVGTGSNDIRIEDAFVPDGRTVSIPDMVEGCAPGASLHPSPLYHTPMIPILMTAASMPLIGHARVVAEGLRDRLATHVRLNAPSGRAEKPAAQMRLADAMIRAHQAELLLRDVVADVMERRNRASHEDRARWSSSICHAVHQARGVIQDVSEASGASSHFLDQPLQRAVRDVNVASCHIAFDHDAQRELYGKLLLGQPPGFGLF